MDNPDRRLAAYYPLRLPMMSRFGDVDSLRHLNNVAQARFYEEGIVALHRAALSQRPSRGSGVIFQITLRYLAEGRYPAPLELGIGVGRLGNSSYTIAMALFESGACISLCDTVVVFSVDGAAQSIPDDYRTGLGRFLVTGPP